MWRAAVFGTFWDMVGKKQENFPREEKKIALYFGIESNFGFQYGFIKIREFTGALFSDVTRDSVWAPFACPGFLRLGKSLPILVLNSFINR